MNPRKHFYEKNVKPHNFLFSFIKKNLSQELHYNNRISFFNSFIFETWSHYVSQAVLPGTPDPPESLDYGKGTTITAKSCFLPVLIGS